MRRTVKIYRKTRHRVVCLLSMMTLLTMGFTASGQQEFITTWLAIGSTITIPTTGGGYNYDISWAEIGNPSNSGSAAGITGNHTISLPNTNEYRVKITGQFPRIYFNDGNQRLKILTVEQWGNIAWTDMSEAFSGCVNLTVPAADAPDLSGVLSLRNMFRNAIDLNVDHIDLWDVSHVEYMNGMFYSCHNFNGNIGNWDVSKVTNMGLMFRNADSFNQDISNWDVGNVTNMGGMFGNLPAFNQNISTWDVSKVTDMNVMFENATAFNQDLGTWDVTQVSNMTNMLSNSGLSSENYHLTLAGWASKNVKTNVPLGAQGLVYSANDAGRKILRLKSWTITGDICTNCSFITTWQATGNTITIPTTGGGYNYNISWEEIGNELSNNGSATATGSYTINTTNANQYRVKITGQFPRIHFNDGGDKNKILTIAQWGDITWTNMADAFFGCSNLTVPASDAPDLSGVLSLANMFRNATNLTVDHIDLWDVSHVTNMGVMFWNASSFNDDISNWNVGNVTNMGGMFWNATAFNQNIGNWDVSKVTNMNIMFQNATSFNHALGNWDVRSVTNMNGMFQGATSFNQDIGTWDVSHVTNMSAMFEKATAFNQDIGNWDVGNVTHMAEMFWDATAFNQNIGHWDVSNVTTMVYMFRGATAFNQNISNWDVSNVTTMSSMFRDAASFNQDIGSWNVGNVTNMNTLFQGAASFDQDISSWNVANVTNMVGMFWNATAFNQDIGSWNVGNVTNMALLFENAASFDQNISSWNVGNVTDMGGMFWGATAFNQNLANWDITQVVNMTNMLSNSGLSRENYDLTLTGWASQNVKTGVPFGAVGLAYCDGETARNTLISGKSWTITGDARYCPQVITFNTLSAQTYGDVFDLTATASSGLPVIFSSSDPAIATISGNTITVLGSGSVTITASQDGNANFEAASPEQQTLMVNPKPVTITVDGGQGKVYGEVDQTLTYAATPSLINNDVFSGSLARVSGENVGAYAINQNTLTAGSNYVITYVGSDFNIAPKPITVTADAGLTSIYGEADPTFTFTVFPALVSGDVFTGSLARTAGENVGTYAINQNTLTAGNNYTISYVGSDFSITPKAITVTADAGQTSIYGEADPTFTFTVSPALVSGDVFTGSLARTAGENVGTYAINQNTLTAGNNYTISYVGSDFSITPKAITVTADAGKSKRYGEADPAWTYTVSPPLVNGDVITGSLARAPGENIGAYAIHQHTLTAGSNYTIVYVSADFHIMKLSQTILFDPIPDKTLGEEPFFLVATASSSLPLFFTSSNESVATISDNVVTIIGTGEVTITATQPGNDIYDPQEAMETLTIHASSIFIPTLFSPDGNGVNDMFRVRGADIAEIQFVVFDLLGNEVYRATDAVTATERGWDGTKGGKDQPAGTYSWMLRGKLKNGASLSFEGKSYGQVVLMR